MASVLQLGVTVCFACASEPRKDEDGSAGDGGDAGRAATGGSSGRGGSSPAGGNAGAAGDGDGGDPGAGGTGVGGSESTGGVGASGGSDASGGSSGSNSGGTGGSAGATNGGGASGGTAGNGGSSGSGGSSGGVSLVGNGDFSAGMEGWGVEISAGGPVSIDAEDGRLCVEAGTNAAQVVVGWPQGSFSPLTLAPGVDYTFSFMAVATRSIQVIGKLGLVSPPYTPYDSQIVYVSGTWQTFTHSFVLNSGSDSIGVAISFTLGALDAVCIDDVTVTSP